MTLEVPAPTMTREDYERLREAIDRVDPLTFDYTHVSGTCYCLLKRPMSDGRTMEAYANGVMSCAALDYLFAATSPHYEAVHGLTGEAGLTEARRRLATVAREQGLELPE